MPSCVRLFAMGLVLSASLLSTGCLTLRQRMKKTLYDPTVNDASGEPPSKLGQPSPANLEPRPAPDKTQESKAPRTESERAAAALAEATAKRVKPAALLVGHHDRGRIHVEIQNNSDRDMVVGPKNLAVATAGGRNVFPFEDYAPGLPITKLRPGDRVAGYLVVNQLKSIPSAQGPITAKASDLNGARLLFQYPGMQIVVTPLRPAQPGEMPTP